MTPAEIGNMRIKKTADHNVVQTPTCGELREILRGGEFEGFDLALAVNIGPTKAHYHDGFSEVYFVVDGTVTLETFEPATGKRTTETLAANELCVIEPGVHHKISEASAQNRLCVVSCPGWTAADEHLSDML